MFVRTASERDLAAIRVLPVETRHASYDAIYGVERVIQISNEWHSISSLGTRLTHPNAEFVVAHDGREIVGMAVAATGADGNSVMLHQLYVRPSQKAETSA